MVIDHIGVFFVNTPIFFRYIGRIAAPIFFYCTAWGFYHTRNRKVYLIRLYLLGILMSISNIIIFYYGEKTNTLNNNIFTTLFLGCMVVFIFDREGQVKEKLKWLMIVIIQQIIAFWLCTIFAEFLQIPYFVDIDMLYYGYGALFGSFIFTEGSIWFVLFFVTVYFLKKEKKYLFIFILFFSLVLEFLIRRTYYMRGAMSYLIPFDRYQWLMIFSIPFLNLYNGKKGKGNKLFFYIFYPAHIWLLYLLNV